MGDRVCLVERVRWSVLFIQLFVEDGLPLSMLPVSHLSAGFGNKMHPFGLAFPLREGSFRPVWL